MGSAQGAANNREMKMRIELNTEAAKRRVMDGIADCDRFIAKEEGRSADLRPANVQQHLDFCIAHKAKLQNAIAAGFLEI